MVTVVSCTLFELNHRLASAVCVKPIALNDDDIAQVQYHSWRGVIKTNSESSALQVSSLLWSVQGTMSGTNSDRDLDEDMNVEIDGRLSAIMPRWGCIVLGTVVMFSNPQCTTACPSDNQDGNIWPIYGVVCGVNLHTELSGTSAYPVAVVACSKLFQDDAAVKSGLLQVFVRMKPVPEATETCMQLDQKQLLKATWCGQCAALAPAICAVLCRPAAALKGQAASRPLSPSQISMLCPAAYSTSQIQQAAR